MEDETSGWSDVFYTEKVVFIDLPFTMTIDHDLPALNSRQAQVGVVIFPEVEFGFQKLYRT